MKKILKATIDEIHKAEKQAALIIENAHKEGDVILQRAREKAQKLQDSAKIRSQEQRETIITSARAEAVALKDAEITTGKKAIHASIKAMNKNKNYAEDFILKEFEKRIY